MEANQSIKEKSKVFKKQVDENKVKTKASKKKSNYKEWIRAKASLNIFGDDDIFNLQQH